jgi:hypothetical protein
MLPFRQRRRGLLGHRFTTGNRQCRHSGPSNAQGHPIPIPGLDACTRMDQPAGSISLVRRPLEVSSCDGFLSDSIVFIAFDMGGGQCRSGLASVDAVHTRLQRESYWRTTVFARHLIPRGDQRVRGAQRLDGRRIRSGKRKVVGGDAGRGDYAPSWREECCMGGRDSEHLT